MTRYIVIVGRSEDESTFAGQINKSLEEGFEIHGIHSLNEFYEVDNKDRFIAFVGCDDDGLFDQYSSKIAAKIISKGYSAAGFEDLENALAYAAEEYGFSNDEEERNQKYIEFQERFPFFSAEEWEQIQIFDSLYHTGKVQPIRGRYMDEPAIILAHITKGRDEIRITPMMILINDEIHSEIEVPFP